VPGDLDQEEYGQLQHLAKIMRDKKNKDELQHVSRLVPQNVTSLQSLLASKFALRVLLKICKADL
jgi:hypothetical protein